MPPFEDVESFSATSRSRFLARAGAALGGAGLLGAATAGSASAAVPPTEYAVGVFGALGNGLADDAGAIQAAIDAAKNAGGGVVLFHGGIFSISRPLKIYSRVILRGAGTGATFIKKRGTASFAAIESDGFAALTGTESNGGIHSWALEGLSIDGSRADGARGPGIQVYGYGYSIRDVAVFECAGHGIWSEWSAEGVPAARLDAFVSDVIVHDCSAGGILWQGPHDSKWVNVTVFRCVPAGVTSGAVTAGVEIKRESPGLRAVNCHVWGHHKYAWIVGSQGVGLIGCFGEAAEVAQVLINGNMCDIVGGEYFGIWSGNDSVAFEIGTPERACAATYINSLVHVCNRGALHFVNDAGIGRYELFVWQTVGDVITSSPLPATEPHPSNRLDIVFSGGAKPGRFGPLKPFHFPGDVSTRGAVRVGGDFVAGRSTSRLGFFGAEPQPRGAEWTVAAGPMKRALAPGAPLADVRAVLATLIGDLQRFGLLAGGPAAAGSPPASPPADQQADLLPSPAPVSPAPAPLATPQPQAAARMQSRPTSSGRVDRGPLVRSMRRVLRDQRPPKTP